jgi:hypothetical protein
MIATLEAICYGLKANSSHTLSLLADLVPVAIKRVQKAEKKYLGESYAEVADLLDQNWDSLTEELETHLCFIKAESTEGLRAVDDYNGMGMFALHLDSLKNGSELNLLHEYLMLKATMSILHSSVEKDNYGNSLGKAMNALAQSCFIRRTAHMEKLLVKALSSGGKE